MFSLLGQHIESVVLLLAILPLLVMDVVLHRRTAASSAGLASRLAKSAQVLRDGAWLQLPSRDLVPGDVVRVRPGEYFPADGVLVEGEGLQVDESTLTGESLPVVKHVWRKSAGATTPSKTLTHQVIAGTRLLTGYATVHIESIGKDTRYGRIVASVQDTSVESTPLQQAIAEMVKVLLIAALVLCVMLGLVRWWQGHGWIDALISAVTLAVAAIPEEFPVVYTFVLGLGVYRLARKKALVRRAVAVENIGRTTCIVSDKTGTITLGELVFAGATAGPGIKPDEVLMVAALASRSDSGDPMDQALHATYSSNSTWSQLARFPFTEARRRETAIWKWGQDIVAVTKGAPETLMEICNLSEQEKAHWRGQVDLLAEQGHKVIACARSSLAVDMPLVESSNQMEWVGLLSFVDPVKDGVKEAIAQCVASGIRVMMVTGDHPKTALAIAKAIGLGQKEPRVCVLTADANKDEISQAALWADVIARATPIQKFEIVKALQSQGHIVSVTGDGVNDVPALRKADIGIAMGIRGTQSAREVAPIVLMDDNFGTIPIAVMEGRQLFQNLKLAFVYLLLVHIPLVMGATLVPLLGYPLLFLPIHIVWLEILIHPTAMLAFQDVPLRKFNLPAASSQQISFFNSSTWGWIAVSGATIGFTVITSFVIGLGEMANVEYARSLAIGALIVSTVAVVVGLSGTLSKATLGCVVLSLMSFFVLTKTPTLNTFFGLKALGLVDLLLLVILSVLSWLMARMILNRMST